MKKKTVFLLVAVAAVALVLYLRKKKIASAGAASETGSQAGSTGGSFSSRATGLIGALLNSRSTPGALKAGNVFTDGSAAGLLNRIKGAGGGGGGGGGSSISGEGYLDVGGIISGAASAVSGLIKGIWNFGKSGVETEWSRFDSGHEVNKALDALGLNEAEPQYNAAGSQEFDGGDSGFTGNVDSSPALFDPFDSENFSNSFAD